MTRGKNEIENNSVFVIYVCPVRLFGPRGVDSSRRPLIGFSSLSLVYTHAAGSCVRERHRRRGKTCAAQMKLQTHWRINLVCRLIKSTY